MPRHRLPPMLPPLRLVNGRILREGQMRQRSLGIARGRITRGPLPAVDLSGYDLMPGIVDLQSLALDQADPPRLQTLAESAARAGITTQFLSIGWSWEPARSPARATAMLAHHQTRAPYLPIDQRIQLAVETHMPEEGAALLDAVRRYKVGYLTLTNRAETVMEAHRFCPERLPDLARMAGLDPERPSLLLDAAALALSKARAVPRHLCQLAEALDDEGIPFASRGDVDGERREYYSMLGARICEAPLVYSAAAIAKAMGEVVLMGADEMLGAAYAPGCCSLDPDRRSFTARELLPSMLCDALFSGAAPAAPLDAALRLTREGQMDLPEAWALVSSQPADILRLADRGRLDLGARADVVAIHRASGKAHLTISRGHIAYIAPELIDRFDAAETELSHFLAAE